MSYINKLFKKVEARKNENAFRSLTLREGLTDFFSNDYLGFACDIELYKHIKSAEDRILTTYYNGSTGSRLLSGNSLLAEQTEKQLAFFFQAERALLFNSGYNANVGVLSSIPQKGDTIIYDELIHASLKDGARLSFAERISFRHNDTEDLERKIQKAKGDIFVVIESVYSMDGDQVPLKDIVAVCKKYKACIIVDEAHSTGTIGAEGKGLVIAEQLQDDVDIRIHTFGKAMGIHGACVTGSSLLIDYLINFSRSFIYTTAFSPHSFISVQESFLYLEQHPERISMLHTNIQLFQSYVKDHVHYIHSDSPIQVLKVKGNDRVKYIAEQIQKSGFDVRPIVSPTVKKGEERIRFCIHAFNTEKEIQELAVITKELL
jgi:8-amino-7-oxononanoate synthase